MLLLRCLRLEGPGRMFDARPFSFLTHNLYMGPNLLHSRWAPWCVVCSTLICGLKFVQLQVDYCYLLRTALVFPEEEGMMQQSSVSISLSF